MLGRRALLRRALLSLGAPLARFSAQGSRASDAIFDFHSGFWINLHHFLYQEAQPEEAGQRSQDTSEKATSDWSEAVSFYQKTLVSRDLLFDDGMVAIKNSLEDQEDAASLVPSGTLSETLIAVLAKAAPVYRSKWWAEQDQANRRWIEGVKLLVDRDGEQLRRELSRIYGTPWPSGAIRVDVTNFASWAGAYTTNHPTRITISSVDSGNQDVAALETLFHEASHGISDKLERAISDECARQHVLLPRRDLWHAVIFFTAGELVRRDFPRYTPYAYKNGLWKRAWPMYPAPLERDWKPYLDGKVSFDAAVASLVQDVGQSKVSH